MFLLLGGSRTLPADCDMLVRLLLDSCAARDAGCLTDDLGVQAIGGAGSSTNACCGAGRAAALLAALRLQRSRPLVLLLAQLAPLAAELPQC